MGDLAYCLGELTELRGCFSHSTTLDRQSGDIDLRDEVVMEVSGDPMALLILNR